MSAPTANEATEDAAHGGCSLASATISTGTLTVDQYSGQGSESILLPVLEIGTGNKLMEIKTVKFY